MSRYILRFIKFELFWFEFVPENVDVCLAPPIPGIELIFNPIWFVLIFSGLLYCTFTFKELSSYASKTCIVSVLIKEEINSIKFKECNLKFSNCKVLAKSSSLISGLFSTSAPVKEVLIALLKILSLFVFSVNFKRGYLGEIWLLFNKNTFEKEEKSVLLSQFKVL